MVSTLTVPWLIKPLLGWYLRRNIVNSLWTAGSERYSDAEVDEVVVEWLDALQAKFADGREWLMGVGVVPGIVDATVWGFLINFLGGVRCFGFQSTIWSKFLGTGGWRDTVLRPGARQL